MHAYEAADDHASGGPPAPHLAVEDQGIAGGHILDMVVEHVEDGFLGGLPVSEGQAIVLHPVALLPQLVVHLPGGLHTLWTCSKGQPDVLDSRASRRALLLVCLAAEHSLYCCDQG